MSQLEYPTLQAKWIKRHLIAYAGKVPTHLDHCDASAASKHVELRSVYKLSDRKLKKALDFRGDDGTRAGRRRDDLERVNVIGVHNETQYAISCHQDTDLLSQIDARKGDDARAPRQNASERMDHLSKNGTDLQLAPP